MFADIDKRSLASAEANVVCNGLQTRIHVVQAPSASPILFPLSEDFNHGVSRSDGSHFDFTMCNPPFYSSRDEVEKSARDKAFAVCTGADIEMITPDGEYSFVCQMVQERIWFTGDVADMFATYARYLFNSPSIRWYTSVLGKDVDPIPGC